MDRYRTEKASPVTCENACSAVFSVNSIPSTRRISSRFSNSHRVSTRVSENLEPRRILRPPRDRIWADPPSSTPRTGRRSHRGPRSARLPRASGCAWPHEFPGRSLSRRSTPYGHGRDRLKHPPDPWTLLNPGLRRSTPNRGFVPARPSPAVHAAPLRQHDGQYERTPVDGTLPHSRHRRHRVQTSRPGLPSRPDGTVDVLRAVLDLVDVRPMPDVRTGNGLGSAGEEITHEKSDECVQNQPGDKCRRQE